jgi:hypothetical protein
VKNMKRVLALGILVTLVLTGLVLIPADPALARTHFFFGLNLGVPLAPYPAYSYPYPAPAYYYPPAPYYRAYPPCARAWVPGYYDAYGNWVFGYYRYDRGGYGHGY